MLAGNKSQQMKSGTITVVRHRRIISWTKYIYFVPCAGEHGRTMVSIAAIQTLKYEKWYEYPLGSTATDIMIYIIYHLICGTALSLINFL